LPDLMGPRFLVPHVRVGIAAGLRPLALSLAALPCGGQLVPRCVRLREIARIRRMPYRHRRAPLGSRGFFDGAG
jgi:hypothetical protein